MTVYKIAAIPTEYAGVRFRSRLEARWACFFDLICWSWDYEPLDIAGWTPDFLVTPMYLNYEMLVEVKPYSKIEQFRQDDACRAAYRLQGEWNPCVAFFGLTPRMTQWYHYDASGGGEACLLDGFGFAKPKETYKTLWDRAGSIVQRNGMNADLLNQVLLCEKFIYWSYIRTEPSVLGSYPSYQSYGEAWRESWMFDLQKMYDCIAQVQEVDRINQQMKEGIKHENPTYRSVV